MTLDEQIAQAQLTRLGMLALLEHAVSHDTDGHAWPDEWREGLLENLSEELPKLWQEGRV